MDTLDEVRNQLLEAVVACRDIQVLMRLVDLGIEVAETAQTLAKLRLREESGQEIAGA